MFLSDLPLRKGGKMDREKAVIKVHRIMADIIDRDTIGNEFQLIPEHIKDIIFEDWIKILMEE
jgi:hypothetical protein